MATLNPKPTSSYDPRYPQSAYDKARGVYTKPVESILNPALQLAAKARSDATNKKAGNTLVNGTWYAASEMPQGSGSVAGGGQAPGQPSGDNTGTGQPNSVSDILSSMGGEDQFTTDYYKNLQNTATGVIDENAIRTQKEKEYQAQIDSVNALYADKLNQSRLQGQGRSGQASILQGSMGLLGSNVGSAIDDKTTAYNTSIEDSVNAERQSAINDIYKEVRDNATTEIAKKTAAKQAGAKDYLEYLAGASERKASKNSNAAKILLSKGVDPKTVSDEELKKLGLTRDDLTMAYNELKSGADKTAATEATAAETTRLGQAKTQAEINKINTEASKNYEEGGIIYNAQGQQIGVKQGENYEAGGKIYKAGTNEYLGDAVKAGGTTGSGTSGTKNPGTIVTTKLNNGQTITTGSNVASALQNVVNIIPGVKFDAQNAYRTADDQAKLYGQGRTAEQLQADGVNIAYAQPGKPVVTWTLQSNHMSGNAVDVVGDKNYLDSIETKMNEAGFTRPKETMARGDYGHFEYVGTGGGTSGLSELAQSVQKQIITIAQIPSAQRSAVAAELAQAGTQSPKSKELQNSLDLVDTMLQDEDALKSISGWWGGRLPGSGIFSNQLAANQFDQLKGILSLGEREKLKGTGAISDYESKLLANSASALGRNLSEADFKAELEKIRDILSGKYKYYTDGGGQISTGGTPPPAPTGNSTTIKNGVVINFD